MDTELSTLLREELSIKAALGYSYFLNIIRGFKEYEDYKEINEEKEHNQDKYRIRTEILWDDEPEEKIRVVIEVRCLRLFFFSKNVRDYFLIDENNRITKT